RSAHHRDQPRTDLRSRRRQRRALHRRRRARRREPRPALRPRSDRHHHLHRWCLRSALQAHHRVPTALLRGRPRVGPAPSRHRHRRSGRVDVASGAVHAHRARAGRAEPRPTAPIPVDVPGARTRRPHRDGAHRAPDPPPEHRQAHDEALTDAAGRRRRPADSTADASCLVCYVAGASMDRRTPVLVGAGQVTNRRERVVSALDLMAEAATAAFADAGGRIAKAIDAVWVVHAMSWQTTAPARRVAERLALPPGDRATTTIGGNTPPWLVARACDAVARGELTAVLIVGAEAIDSARRGPDQDPANQDPGARDAAGVDVVIGDDRWGVGPAEIAVGIGAPAHLYPLFESVLAARAGRSPAHQRAWLGELLAPMSERAAQHRDLAWFPTPLTAEQIAKPGEDNRLVAEPYTKRMNSIIQVDQGAALVVTSLETVADLGIPSDRVVFPWSAAECNDVFLPSERPDLGRSPAIAAAGAAALEAAGIGIDDVACFDLYSCFPSAMQIAADALGVDPLDPRGLTVTGAMPYFGGPGN